MLRRLLIILAAAWAITLAVPPAHAAGEAERDNARAELAGAQEAYAKALAQLRAAEARLATARVRALEAGVDINEVEGLGDLAGSDASSRQPADETPEKPTKKAEESTEKENEQQPAKKSKQDQPPPKEVEKEDKGPSFWEGWKRSVRLGLNASSGDSEDTSINIQFNTQRKGEKYLTRIDSTYRYATRDGEETQNRLDIRGRHEWLAKNDSKIGWWVTARAEFDEFRSWDTRLQGHGGISYQFIKNKKTNLKGRTGFGGSQTYGSPNDEFRPEALVTGIDLSHRFNETMNVRAGTEFFLEIDNETRQRFDNNVQWNILLDKESNMNLRFEVSHQYDSKPGGNREENNIYFDATLGWRF